MPRPDAPTQGEVRCLEASLLAVLDRAERIVARQSPQERLTAEIFLRPTPESAHPRKEQADDH